MRLSAGWDRIWVMKINKHAKFSKFGMFNLTLFKMRDYKPPFEPNYFYHVYNKGNNKECIFQEDKNYRFFLKKWNEYLGNFANVWSYCLMPNHFHFLIKVDDGKRLAKFSKLGKSSNQIISNQFRKLFISYTKSFNKVYDRTGSLFQKPFKRIKIDSENYLLMLIHYIHHNPIHHNFTDGYKDWTYSSYSTIASASPTKVKRKEVLKFFGGEDAFIEYHKEMKNYNKIEHLIIE